MSDSLLRLTAITAVVMTMLAAVMPFAPALAAPDQGDGYWQDTFSDSTGISDPTNIAVSGGDVKLILGSSTSNYNFVGVTRASGPHDAYYCDEDDNSTPPALDERTEATDAQYILISANDGSRWQTLDPGSNDYAFMEFIQQVTEPKQNITNIDLTWIGYGEVAGTFKVWIYNSASASWSQLGSTQEIAAGADGTLTRSITTNIPDYISATGMLTWGVFFDETTTGLFSNGRFMRTNYVQASVTYSYYSNPGSLNSVIITPANLQSWGTFNATDNTTCLPYRKPISITGTGTALTNYQISVPVTYVAGKMNSSFSDLRFKDSSGNTLSYWIESYVASTSAQVWVKVPSIAASGTTTIYMYYGSATATSASNGADTFIFFDDFSGDLSKWTKHVNGANINIVSGYLECGGGTTAAPYGHTVLGSSASYSGFTNGIIDGKVYLTTDSIAEVGYRGSYAANTGYKSRMDTRAGQGLGHLMPPYSDWGFIPTGGGPSGTAIPTGTWYPFSIIANGSSLNISCAGQALTGTDTSYAGPGEISLQNHYGTYSRFDDMRVRKYASTTPALSTGSEQSGSYCGFTNPGAVTSITYKILNAADDSVLCTITAAQAAAGYDISSCAVTASAIKLRTELSTSNPSQTPILYDWRVTWTSVIPVTINITAPTDISGWNLDPAIGENPNSGTLAVDVTPGDAIWSVTAKDVDTATGGYMTEWSGSAYGTAKLANPMRVQGPDAEVILPNDAGVDIASGTGDYPSINITFKQYVTWDDDPGTYQIVVTFIATVD